MSRRDQAPRAGAVSTTTDTPKSFCNALEMERATTSDALPAEAPDTKRMGLLGNPTLGAVCAHAAGKKVVTAMAVVNAVTEIAK
jgi:hypothetical protein